MASPSPGSPSRPAMASVSPSNSDTDGASSPSDVLFPYPPSPHHKPSQPLAAHPHHPQHPQHPQHHPQYYSYEEQHTELRFEHSNDHLRRSVTSGNSPPRSRSHTIDSVSFAAGAVAATPPPAPVSARQTPPSAFANSPIKRKPVSSTASSVVASTTSRASPSPLVFSYFELPKPDQRFSRAPSIDSPTLYDYPASAQTSFPPSQPLDVNLAPAEPTGPESHDTHGNQSPAFSAAELSDVLSVYDDLLSDRSSLPPDVAQDARFADAIDDSSDDIDSIYGDNINSNPSTPMFASKPTPPHLRLQKVDTSVGQEHPHLIIQTESPESEHSGGSPQLNKPLPKSPSQVSPLASLFGWGNPSPSVTEFSSIPASPSSPTKNGLANEAPRSIDTLSPNTTKTNASTTNPIEYCDTHLSTPPLQVGFQTVQVDEMEDELKAISSELAASIRREMDLEDLVDRLQDQVSNPQAPSKRTSDYFSDSGYSSAKLSENDQTRDEIEKITRRSEQEKASLRLELTNKLQDERTRRKGLDQQIRELAEKASQIDLAQINNLDANGRLRDLENTCEDLRRRLSEERQSKTNFEDLLSALKGELSNACNERDNLRDEVVPQLRARVEGLETEAAEYSSLTYESTKMQQQLQSLKKENTSLRNSSIGGPEDLLSRSNAASAASFLSQRGPLGGLSRSDSVKNAQPESREALAERLKDVEAQRDALHNALKNLLDRQEFQNRENQKKIRVLENERQRLLVESPKKAGFERDISNLRTEINVLRRRAEDALEQKWQVEKGLGGLKMDLDRAEEEIASLRSLLQEKDILIPPFLASSNGSNGMSGAPVTSQSLENSYRELQAAYSESLERIKKLEVGSASDPSGEKIKLAMDRLEKSLSAAVTARDAALQEVNGLKQQYSDLAAGEKGHTAAERALADELSESAHRVEQLASHVRQQLSTNAELRSRLSDTVARGETDRKANSDRITGLQERLRGLEDQLVNSQTASEDRVGRHEDEITKLRDAHNEQLRRINSGHGIGFKTAGKAPLLKAATTGVFSRTSSIMPTKSFEEEVEIKTLRAHVAELEKALADAEKEMQEVVARMSAAQIEVMNLQEERETAARETRRLQNLLQEEQSKASGLRR